MRLPTARTLGPAGLLMLACLAAAPDARALTINITYDSSITSLGNAATVQAAISSVAQQFEAAVANNITVNLNMAWGKVNTSALTSGDVADTVVNAFGFYSYAQVKSFLSGTAGTLPTADPTGTGRFMIPQAQAKALNLSGVSYQSVDAYIGFSNTAPFAYDDSVAIPALSYDFKGIVSHEIEHALGRVTGLLSSTPIYGYAADIFRYSAPGTNSFTYNTPTGTTQAYASIDGGVTKLGTYADQATAGDRSDWNSPTGTTNPPNAQNARQVTGVDYCLSTADERLLTGLGYSFTAYATSLFQSGSSCAPSGAVPAAYAAMPASSPVNAPEPASLGLLAAGVATLGALRRRRAATPG